MLILYAKYLVKMLCMVRLRNKNVPRPDQNNIVPARNSTSSRSCTISNYCTHLRTHYVSPGLTFLPFFVAILARYVISEPRCHTVEMYASAVMAFTDFYTANSK